MTHEQVERLSGFVHGYARAAGIAVDLEGIVYAGKNKKGKEIPILERWAFGEYSGPAWSTKSPATCGDLLAAVGDYWDEMNPRRQEKKRRGRK